MRNEQIFCQILIKSFAELNGRVQKKFWTQSFSLWLNFVHFHFVHERIFCPTQLSHLLIWNCPLHKLSLSPFSLSKEVAIVAGHEPSTLWLLGDCSTTVLPPVHSTESKIVILISVKKTFQFILKLKIYWVNFFHLPHYFRPLCPLLTEEKDKFEDVFLLSEQRLKRLNFQSTTQWQK